MFQHTVFYDTFFLLLSSYMHIWQISGTAIRTKLSPQYACLFKDRIENDFLDSETFKPWL